jgi:putrescine transport system substrate-binding protein
MARTHLLTRPGRRGIPAAVLGLLALIYLALASPAAAEDSPFAPPPQAKSTFLRLLAFADYFDTAALDEFESQSGLQIAYDAYDAPESIPAKLREGPYDLVVLPGQMLRVEIAAGGLQKLDKAKLAHASRAAPAVVAKLAAYDPAGAFALPYMWFATGLVYDTGPTLQRLRAPPTSWATLFAPDQARHLVDCGIATADNRDDLFMAVWRFMGVNPAKVNLLNIKAAADLLIKVKASARAFALRDYVGALVNESVCLSTGRAADAALAIARAKQGGRDAAIDFVVPKEGAPMSIDALAIPKDAAHANEAYALMDFLLRPEIATRNARATGLTSGDDAGSEDVMKRLFPTGALDASLAPILDKEWARVRGEGSASGEAKHPPVQATEPKPAQKASPRHKR